LWVQTENVLLKKLEKKLNKEYLSWKQYTNKFSINNNFILDWIVLYYYYYSLWKHYTEYALLIMVITICI